MISTLKSCPCPASRARAASGVSSLSSNGWSAAIDSRIRSSIVGRSSGVSGRGNRKS